jgi:short-chain Z-isoprenyl diphosphate synthase
VSSVDRPKPEAPSRACARLPRVVQRRLRQLTAVLEAPAYSLYTRRLWRQIAGKPPPRHLAVVLDGNRRYSRRGGLGSLRRGYEVGADRVFDIVSWSSRTGIEVVTLWAVSLDNLRRPQEQVGALFQVLQEALVDLTEVARREGWRLRGIGRTDLLSPGLSGVLWEAERLTAAGSSTVVQIAVAYGGQEEILDALQLWSRSDGVRGRPVEEALRGLNPETVRAHLYSGELPDPDLILRTSGELRLSGFLLWQSVYSEFYFTDVLWPEFREVDFLRAVRSYQSRQRRFGR